MFDLYYASVYALGFSAAVFTDAFFLNESRTKTWKWLSFLNCIFWGTVVAFLGR